MARQMLNEQTFAAVPDSDPPPGGSDTATSLIKIRAYVCDLRQDLDLLHRLDRGRDRERQLDRARDPVRDIVHDGLRDHTLDFRPESSAPFFTTTACLQAAAGESIVGVALRVTVSHAERVVNGQRGNCRCKRW